MSATPDSAKKPPTAPTGVMLTTIEPARRDDFPAIGALLEAAGLPLVDDKKHWTDFYVARRGGTVIGAVGMERHGEHALLRSLVVSPGFTGAGLGTALVRAINRHAQLAGVKRFYLLTMTASRFFEKLGFIQTGRGDVPSEIAATGQFRGTCPSSALCFTAVTLEVLR